uniref:Uncharacterized protein n=1 Tax=Anguilla anguilla TaxID=7936 RepID=A0A0E9V1D1_ANGAN
MSLFLKMRGAPFGSISPLQSSGPSVVTRCSSLSPLKRPACSCTPPLSPAACLTPRWTGPRTAWRSPVPRRP